MRVSDVTVEQVADFLRLDDASSPQLVPMMAAAKQFIIDYTGLTEAELDEHEDFYHAYQVLIQDMYDNRAMHIDKGSVNPVVESTLFRHRRNFI